MLNIIFRIVTVTPSTLLFADKLCEKYIALCKYYCGYGKKRCSTQQKNHMTLQIINFYNMIYLSHDGQIKEEKKLKKPSSDIEEQQKNIKFQSQERN